MEEEIVCNRWKDLADHLLFLSHGQPSIGLFFFEDFLSCLFFKLYLGFNREEKIKKSFRDNIGKITKGSIKTK